MPYPKIEMVTIEEFIKPAEKVMNEQTGKSMRMHEAFQKYLLSHEEKRSLDLLRDTGGMFFCSRQ